MSAKQTIGGIKACVFDAYGTLFDVHSAVGKVSFEPKKLVENIREFVAMVNKLKPTAAKGTYIQSVYLSSTMSPGIKIDPKSI